MPDPAPAMPTPACRSLLHLCLRWLLVACLGLGALALRAQPAAALQLDDTQPRVDAWPAVTVLSDPVGRLGVEGVLQRLGEFQAPTGPHANLGPRRDVVWLHLPLRVQGGDGRWVLDIDYPPLNEVQLWVLRDGRPVLQQTLGNTVPFDQRALPSRTHAVHLDLPPDLHHDLLLRVHTTSAMLLPISLVKPLQFQAQESHHQLLQGVLVGVALALLAYSLAHWLGLRDGVFLEYALIIGGVTVFFVAYFGIGNQHLWNEQTGLLAKVAPLAVLVALAAAGQFVTSVLQARTLAPRAHALLMVITATSLTGFMASIAGWLDYRQTQILATLMGPMPMLVAMPVAYVQARQGSRVAFYMLLGWTAYMGGACTQAALLRGWVGVDFWSQHLFQFASLAEMLAWTRVLGLRIAGIRRTAERTELEKQALVSLAHTDALTSLPNRRGLQQALAQMLPTASGDSAVVVYLLDLDGFKPVNDRLGHDAGDELLVQVGKRLTDQLRHSDVVARLGGDEFVIATRGVASEGVALALGRKLLDAFDAPFDVNGQPCRVGLTIGFAMAPHDGREAEDLLKRADAAMYAGKQAGRHTVRRGGATSALRPQLS